MTEQDRSLGLEGGGTQPDRGGPGQSWLPFALGALVSLAAGVGGTALFVRSPQYVAFFVIMLGFLLQWPTLATLLLFPVLSWSYVRLARKEARRMEEAFGCCRQAYAHGRPAFLPRLARVRSALPSFRERKHARIDGQRFTASAGAPATRGRTS